MTSSQRPLRVLIANERFLARFGVDRILLLLADRLQSLGMEISFACLRHDPKLLDTIGARVETMATPDGLDLISVDDFVARDLLARWRDAPIDVFVSGGWPFFKAAAKAAELGVRSVFIDAGAVPHDGLGQAALPAQLALRRLRQMTLPSIGAVLPISAFIRDSQTIPDRGHAKGVTTILLGADHLDIDPLATQPAAPLHLDMGDQTRAPFTAEVLSAEGTSADRRVLTEISNRHRRGEQLILGLGRVETEGYKNSLQAYDVLRSVLGSCPKAHFLLLTGAMALDVPPDLAGKVTTMPTLSDIALREVMRHCVLGLSLSLWEGFNLPIAEMQSLGRPVLAYALGAHPEIIADPWFLANSLAELTMKAATILKNGVPDEIPFRSRIDAFRARFTWDATLARWVEAITSGAQPHHLPTPRVVMVDVSNSARDPANSGVVRVTRRLAAELAKHADLDLIFVRWNGDNGQYERLTTANIGFLSSNAGPHDWRAPIADRLGAGPSLEPVLASVTIAGALPPVLLLPEVILDDSAPARTAFARRHGWRIAAILYDMLPIFEARFVAHRVAKAFPNYLAGLREADALYAISVFSLKECERWHVEQGLSLPSCREAIWLPAQFSDQPRRRDPPADGPVLHLLCVSTIEPRKNHRVLIEAFRSLKRRRPEIDLTLHLVGNRYADAAALARWLDLARQAEPSIIWHGVLSDAQLLMQYEQAAFTIYPSLAEGFGLPVLESLWMGRPCLCHEDGVMAELAADGGCLTVDMRSANELSVAIEMLHDRKDLRAALTRQSLARPIDTWADYARRIGERLSAL